MRKSLPDKWLAHEGAGHEHVTLADRAFWLGDDADRRWLNALDKVDRLGDPGKGDLLELLQSQRAQELQWLADLLRRFQLKRKRGGQQSPIYNRSRKELNLSHARDAIRAQRRRKVKLDLAIAAVAKQYGLPESTLRNHWTGKRGGTRRANSRIKS